MTDNQLVSDSTCSRKDKKKREGGLCGFFVQFFALKSVFQYSGIHTWCTTEVGKQTHVFFSY